MNRAVLIEQEKKEQSLHSFVLRVLNILSRDIIDSISFVSSDILNSCSNSRIRLMCFKESQESVLSIDVDLLIFFGLISKISAMICLTLSSILFSLKRSIIQKR